MQTLDVGEVAAIATQWWDAQGDPAEPSAITLTIIDPNGAQTTVLKAAMTGSESGADPGTDDIWTALVTVGTAGVWRFTPVGTVDGNTVTQQEQMFLVGLDAHTGPCDPWLTPADVFTMKPASDIPTADRDYAKAEEMADAASRLLFALSGSVYTGLCLDTVRPCRRCDSWVFPSWWSWHSSWGLCGCGASSQRACGCTSLHDIRLNTAPVHGIVDVYVDGALLSPSAYRVDDKKWLVRLDGEGWPSCQDLTADPTSDDRTFQVTYVFGRMPPADGVLAAKRLAGDLLAGELGLECSLPANVQSIVRAGVQYEMGDPSQELKDGILGLVEVDRFLTAERYSRSHRQTVIASPDMLPQVRRIG